MQILKYGSEKNGFFAYDGSLGIYVATPGKLQNKRTLDQGDVIRIEGVTNPGYFSPHIIARKITLLRKAPLPEPTQATQEIIDSPHSDCGWFQLEGIIVDTVPSGNAFSLRMVSHDRIYNLVLPHTKQIAIDSKTLINRAVRVRGVAATQWNSRRQMTGRFFQLHSLADVELLHEDNSIPPVIEIDQLLRMETSSLRAVKVQGVVTHQDGAELYLQGRGGALLIKTINIENFEPGQEVSVIGTVVHSPFAPLLLSWKVIPMLGRIEPNIRGIRLDESPFPIEWHRALVNLQATVLDQIPRVDGVQLTCESDGVRFPVIFRGGELNREPLANGTLVSLTGICKLNTTNIKAHTYFADRFQLSLRSSDDLFLLSKPSWWTTRRIVTTVIITLASITLPLFWIFLLQRKVSQQTQQIHGQVEREVTMRERERLARDLHDSLEQNIAGLARQLSTMNSRLHPQTHPDLRNSLYLARRMAEHCQRESRESIHDLRQNLRIPISEEWRDEFLLAEADQQGVSIDFKLIGKGENRGTTVERNISKIIREASFNALKHGGAKTIQIIRDESTKMLKIMIIDDGCGFDHTKPVRRGHFGLQGMTERAQRINGSLKVESSPGEGSCITLEVPDLQVVEAS